MLLPTANCLAQQFTSFSKNSDRFLKEMAALFQKTDNKKQGKILIEQFAELWNNNAFSGNQKKLIYTTSNALLTKKARVFPHFNLYITTLMAFAKSNQDIETFNEWDESLLYLLNTKKISLSKIEAFLKVSYGLFSDNTIFQSSTAKWVASSQDYRFEIAQAEREIQIVFDTTDLVCYSKKDSANIYETQGTFYVLKKIWKGKNGKVTWQRAGFNKDKVFANLQDYQIDMKKANYKADSVVFYHTNYFQEPLLGSLDEKILASAVPEKASYPKFESYTKRVELKNIYPNIHYNGGFTMKGSKFIGSGSEKEDAYVYIYRNDTLFLIAASKHYIFKKDTHESISPITLRHIRRYQFATENLKGKKILDIACGTGYGSDLLGKEIDYTGVDISKKCIQYAKKHYGRRFICVSIYNIQFKNEIFDTIVSFETIEHLKYPLYALKYIFNLLSKEGRIILSIPLNHPDKIYHKVVYTYPKVQLLKNHLKSIYCFSTREFLQKHLDIIPIQSELDQNVAGTYIGIWDKKT